MGISLKEVSYSYEPKRKNTKYALKNVTLDINEKDEFIAIIGETGSGKSTLVSLFNALNIPTLGEVDVFGIKVKKTRKRKENYNNIRKHVGLVFQFSDYQLFQDTVVDDVMFAPLNFGKTKEEAKKIAIDSLKLVRLNEDTFDKSPFQLSGGEKKLASIAGILAMEPDILIFDEPTAGLDPDTKRKLTNLFKELNEIEHKSIILITHDMNVVNEYASRVLVMRKKELVFDGTPYSLFNNNKDIVEESNIGYPDTYKIIDELENKLSIKIDRNVRNIKELKAKIEEII